MEPESPPPPSASLLAKTHSWEHFRHPTTTTTATESPSSTAAAAAAKMDVDVEEGEEVEEPDYQETTTRAQSSIDNHARLRDASVLHGKMLTAVTGTDDLLTKTL